jgi:hypothetical protein
MVAILHCLWSNNGKRFLHIFSKVVILKNYFYLQLVEFEDEELRGPEG